MSLFYEGLNEALPDAPATHTREETRRVSPKTLSRDTAPKISSISHPTSYFVLVYAR